MPAKRIGRRRENFPDEIRAEAFALDRATCSYSGRNLWLLDHGADPAYQIDWADHITPASLGGQATTDNAATSGWLYNRERGADRKQPPYLFRRGRPTERFVVWGGASVEVIAQIGRFSKIHSSDWYLNRGLWHVWLGTWVLLNREYGREVVRGTDYRAAAALRFLRKWQGLVSRTPIASLESRGLVPHEMTADQRVLLALREATSVEQVRATMDALLPTLRANDRLIEALCTATTAGEVRTLTDGAGGEASALVIERVRRVASALVALEDA